MSQQREAAVEERRERRRHLLTELEDLLRELDFLRDNPEDPEEPYAFVCAPVDVPPHLNSGAIALPEPDPPEVAE